MSAKRRNEIADQRCVVLSSDELSEAHKTAAVIEKGGGQALHMYGRRIIIGHIPEKIEGKIRARKDVRSLTADDVARAPEGMSEAEKLGWSAWNLRQSPEYTETKAYRPRDGQAWDIQDNPEPPDGPGMQHTEEARESGAPALAAEDMSPYLIGSVAVGIIMVEGPTAALQFSQQERTKIVAEVQEGLTWLGRQEPRASVTWAYDIHTIRVAAQPDPNRTGYEPLESLWRDPAMGQLGFSQNFQGVRNYVASIRTSLGTRWGYVGFFTKYPVHHFAYASKPRLVMHYNNDGWGTDNIDRVFTHETGHIFSCPDEYSGSNCNCTARFGFLQEANGNCERCASPFVDCIMAKNTWAMCAHTPIHLGWRDSDGDGILDPVDPLANPQIDWSRLCRRFPAICDLLNIQGAAALRAPGGEPSHESIPLFLLRRVLSDKDMANVEKALASEEDQYISAVMKRLNAITKEIKGRR